MDDPGIPCIDTSRPHPARVYDYLIDGDLLSEQLLRSFGTVNKGLRQWVRSHMGAEPGMTIGRAGVLLEVLDGTSRSG